MIVTKGLEIIAKRDKVTYASNISGKWVDYSLETFEGKALKDAFERFKVIQKEGNQVPNAEIVALKQHFSTEVKPEKAAEKSTTKYVIDAGLNRNGYQTYISGYDDELDCWALSRVPYPTTKARCEYLLAIAKKDIEEKEKNKILKGKSYNTDFKIVEWKE